MWNDTASSNSFKSFGALSDCSIILYIMTERWPASRKYRDLFEAVKKSVLDAISEGRHIPRTAVTSMKNDMQTSIHGLQVDPITESLPDDLEQMISDMTGEPVSFCEDLDITGLNDIPEHEIVDDMQQMFTLGGTGWEQSDLYFNDGYK
jgi:hypothetical protein